MKASTTARPRAETGVERVLVELSPGVEYVAEAAEALGEVRLRTVVQNRGPQPAQYDVSRAVLTAADGGRLQLSGSEEQPSSRVTDSERASPDYGRGTRLIGPGQSLTVTHRYVLRDGTRQARDTLLLSRVSLEDSVRIGERDIRVALELVEAR